MKEVSLKYENPIIISWSSHEDFIGISLIFHVYFIADQLKNFHFIGLPMKTLKISGRFHDKNIQ